MVRQIRTPAGKIWLWRVKIDIRYFRPTEVDILIGDSSKAKKVLGWEPKVKFNELVRIMVDADIKAIEEGTEYKFR